MPFKFQKTADEFTLTVKRIAHEQADAKDSKHRNETDKLTAGVKRLPFTQLGELSSQLVTASGTPLCRIMFSLNKTKNIP